VLDLGSEIVGYALLGEKINCLATGSLETRGNPMEAFSVSTENVPGTERFSHGLGWGDVNNDGVDDVMIAEWLVLKKS